MRREASLSSLMTIATFSADWARTICGARQITKAARALTSWRGILIAGFSAALRFARRSCVVDERCPEGQSDRRRLARELRQEREDGGSRRHFVAVVGVISEDAQVTGQR